MTYTPRTETRSKAFTLVELIVVVVVLGILASIAIVGYRTVVDKSLEAKQKMRMTQILKEAKILYTQKTYTDASYPWSQAVADATDDLPTYSLNAWAEGASAAGGSNLNASTNGWTVQTDTGGAVYSSAPNDIVTSTSGAGVVYVASAISATQGVFGMISATTAPVVWAASCSGSSCDASSATSGPPAGGAYAPGTTVSPGPSLVYSNTAFSTSSANETKSPTASGVTSYSYTGTLPAGVTFNTATGVFTGPSTWAETYTAARSHTGFCVLSTAGAVKCWGWNPTGIIGNGTIVDVKSPYTVFSSGATAVYSSTWSSCAVLTGGVAKCWGQNDQGQLGDGTKVNRSSPVTVAGLPAGVIKVAIGEASSCALTSGGAVWCWGDNSLGAVGDGTTTNRLSPTQVTGLTSGVTDVGVGNGSACALQSGAVKCWGSNWTGVVGDGTYTDRLTPTQVTGLTSGVSKISVTTYSACAIQTGAAKCWGYGYPGEGSVNAQANVPRQPTGLTSGVTDISASSGGCVVQSGAVKCWGPNYNGGVGDGTTTDRATPVQVTGLTSGFTSVMAATNGTGGALDSLGRLWIWTDGGYGQRGDGTTAGASTAYMFVAPANTAGFPATVSVTGAGASGSTTINVTLTSS